MIVVDANILIRVILGRRARHLIESYGHATEFFAPDIAFADAEKYLPMLLRETGKDLADFPGTMR
jgi:predicted nucleic acid-binding protein